MKTIRVIGQFFVSVGVTLLFIGLLAVLSAWKLWVAVKILFLLLSGKKQAAHGAYIKANTVLLEGVFGPDPVLPSPYRSYE